MSLAPHHARNTHRSVLKVPQPLRVERALSALLFVIKTQADNQTGPLLAHTLKPGNCPLGFAGSHIPPIPTEPFSLFSFFFCFCFFFNHLFIWLCQLLVVASGTLTCGRWDLVPGPGRNPDPCTGSAESQPLDPQGSLPFSLLLECPPGFPCIFTQAGKLPLLNHAVPCVSR